MKNSAKRKLKNLAKFIASVPKKHFDMYVWAHSKKMDKKGEDIVCEENANLCGTACCLAGWQVIRKGYCINEDAIVKTKKGKEVGYTPDVARKQLGLSESEASKLFEPIQWPGDFPRTPKGAAKRIRHFVETGE